MATRRRILSVSFEEDGHEQYTFDEIGQLFHVLPIFGRQEELRHAATDSSRQYEAFSVGPAYLKKIIVDQSNKAKIRPVLIALGGLPQSGKTMAVSHLLDHYVDLSPFTPMTRKNERVQPAEGINYYELVAAGFHPLRNLTITEVTKESSCAFGILAAFKKELLEKGQAPLFPDLEQLASTPEAEDKPENVGISEDIFNDPELDNHLRFIFDYLNKCEHMPKGSQLNTKEREFVERLKNVLPTGIALTNIWDFAINKTVLYFLNAMSGHLYNSNTWLFLDIDQDIDKLDEPPFLRQPDDGFMKWRPRLHYLLRACKISQGENRHSMCTIFAKHERIVSKSLMDDVEKLETKVQQAAKHIGVLSLLESAIEPINLKDSELDAFDDYSLKLYLKFQQVICKTPYQDIPLSWVFLRSLFYRHDRIFVAKRELREKAEDCGIQEDSFDGFCKFYTSFGSIFDLTLVDTSYDYVIVKPMRFLKSLDKFFYPEDSFFEKYPTMKYSIVPEPFCKEVYHENYLAFIEALMSIGLVTRVSDARLKICDLDRSYHYYYVPFCSKNSLVTKADPSAVHLITSADTPPIFKLATLVKYLLQSLPDPKLVPSTFANQAIIEDLSIGATVTISSHSPSTKICITNASPTVCAYVIKACHKISENSKNGLAKYKFVMICAKDGNIVDVHSIPSCRQHVLPNNVLCQMCNKAGRADDQLRAWNEALNKHPVPLKCKTNDDLTISEFTWLAEKIASISPDVIPYLAKALELDGNVSPPKAEAARLKFVNQMLLAWDDKMNKGNMETEIEPRRVLARILLGLGSLFNDSETIAVEDQKEHFVSTFEHLARELDIHAPTVKNMQQIQSDENDDTRSDSLEIEKPQKHKAETDNSNYTPEPANDAEDPFELETSVDTKTIEDTEVHFDTKRGCKIINEVLTKHSAALSDLLHKDTLQRVTQGLFAAGLVSDSVNCSPDYKNVMHEYKAMLQFCKDSSELLKHCQSFISVLSNQGGPLKKISEQIADGWAKEMKEQLHICMNFTVV